MHTRSTVERLDDYLAPPSLLPINKRQAQKFRTCPAEVICSAHYLVSIKLPAPQLYCPVTDR
jgi:hypothetical protein